MTPLATLTHRMQRDDGVAEERSDVEHLCVADLMGELDHRDARSARLREIDAAVAHRPHRAAALQLVRQIEIVARRHGGPSRERVAIRVVVRRAIPAPRDLVVVDHLGALDGVPRRDDIGRGRLLPERSGEERQAGLAVEEEAARKTWLGRRILFAFRLAFIPG